MDPLLFDLDAHRGSDPYDTAEFASPTYQAGQAVDAALIEPDNVNGSGEPANQDDDNRQEPSWAEHTGRVPRARPLQVSNVPYPGRVVAAGSYTLAAGAVQQIGVPTAAGAPTAGHQIILRSTAGALIRVVADNMAASSMLGYALPSAAQAPLVLPVDRVTVKNQDLVTPDDVFFIIIGFDRLPE